MANVTYNVNLRTLYVMKYLLDNTDENHPATTAQLCGYLAGKGMPVGRKSVYADLETLGPDGFGLDIISENGRYHIGSRAFELQEVKLLADMVQSSNFITRTKSERLIRKLQTLVSRHDADILGSQIVARNRVKSTNEQMFITIDRISDAIRSDVSIRFKYFKYDMNRKKQYKHNGRSYEVSPCALIAGEDNYYLLAYSHDAEALRHYRVDRMEAVLLTENRRLGKELMAQVDLSCYPSRVFNMYRGPEHRAVLRFHSDLADAVLDRFGKDIMLIPDSADHFHITVPVMESPQFFAWMSGFGNAAEVKSPPALRQHMKEHVQSIARLYEESV
ncbi:MAG: WYL domain-containing protein [Blautia sp.]|nr:WYL domain-containing protein [Blautia sp.]